MKRIKQMQEFLKMKNVDWLVIDTPISLFYLTGLDLSFGQLWINAKDAMLFVDGRYMEIAKKTSPCPVDIFEEKKVLSFLAFCVSYKKIAFDSFHTSYSRVEEMQEFVKKGGQNFSLVPLMDPLRFFRVKKEKKELKLLKKAADLTYEAMEHCRLLLKEGITEKEVAIEFEFFCKKKGAENVSFAPIIAFGKNSSMPHHNSSDTPLKEGDIVLMDLGIVVDHYCSDITRCFFFGKKDFFLSDLYTTVKEAQKVALALCRPGVRTKELDEAAYLFVAKKGYGKNYLHALGHGVGLEVHEYPRIRREGKDKDIFLEEGMVITIEPGLYFSKKGGVRYEDTIVITADGFENFYPI